MGWRGTRLERNRLGRPSLERIRLGTIGLEKNRLERRAACNWELCTDFFFLENFQERVE